MNATVRIARVLENKRYAAMASSKATKNATTTTNWVATVARPIAASKRDLNVSITMRLARAYADRRAATEFGTSHRRSPL